jgi:acyl-CoA thioester hydrolase
MSDAPIVIARVPISIRWRDLDPFNHVNNSIYLTYLEEARLQWLSHLPRDWMSGTIKPVLAATQVNFREQIEWPGNVIVELHCERIGNSSITIAHRILSADGQRVHSDGHVVMVWIDTSIGRAVALPEVIRNAATQAFAE